MRDELFATLDPTTRSIELEEGRKVTLTDTVGFIQKLPTTLVEAFKSTLAEVRAADLVLLVADASDAGAERQIRAVQTVLEEIGANQIPSVLVLNKCDLISAEELTSLQARHPDAGGDRPCGAALPCGTGGLAWRCHGYRLGTVFQGHPYEDGP